MATAFGSKFKGFLILLACFISLNGHALTIEETDTRQVFLRSKDCQKLQELTALLREWAQSQGASVEQSDSSQCVYDGSNREYYLNVTRLLPDWVAQKVGLQPCYSGPNCFNTVLKASGVLPHIRNTTEFELSFFLDSPLCRALKKEENLVSGDIGAVVKKGDSNADRGPFVHTFVYLNDQLILEKQSKFKSGGWRLGLMDQLSSFYKISPAGKDSSSPLQTPDVHEIQYFRCRSWDGYLKDQKDAGLLLSSSTERIDRALTEVEADLELLLLSEGGSYAIKNGNKSAKLLKKRTLGLKKTTEALLNLTVSRSSSGEEEWILKALLERIKGVEGNFVYIRLAKYL